MEKETDFGPVTIKTWKLGSIYAGVPRYTMAVTATHSWTGRSVDVTNEMCRTSMHRLIETALRILRAKVLAKQPPTDRVRTYHTSGYGTWQKDHRTGERIDGVFMELRTKTH